MPQSSHEGHQPGSGRLAIQLIVGLGNPGREYEGTRHNAGFWLVEELARRHGGKFRLEPRFRAELARVQIAGQERWLVKPQDFMNNSGQVTAAVASFYKVTAPEILVAHDELDLPPGALRLKSGGGAGGHNGLKDLIARLGEPYLTTRARNTAPDGNAPGGLGLGIFISKTLLERTGARLSFENAQGGGARVRITWPRKAIES
jgi:peptidyl-tRNA hydrolase